MQKMYIKHPLVETITQNVFNGKNAQNQAGIPQSYLHTDISTSGKGCFLLSLLNCRG